MRALSTKSGFFRKWGGECSVRLSSVHNLFRLLLTVKVFWSFGRGGFQSWGQIYICPKIQNIPSTLNSFVCQKTRWSRFIEFIMLTIGFWNIWHPFFYGHISGYPLFSRQQTGILFYYFPTLPPPPFISRFQYTGDRPTDHNKKGPRSRRKWFFISLFLLIYGILFFDFFISGNHIRGKPLCF